MEPSLEDLIELAVAHERQGRLAQAEECYRQIAVMRPDWAEVQNNLGAAQQRQNKLTEAAESYRRAISLDANYAVAHHNLGTILHVRGELDEAAAHYQRAIAIKPDYAEAHSNLGNILLQRGQPDDAIREYQQALSINPQYAEAHNNLGSALKSQGKLDASAAAYARAIGLNPSYADAHSNLGCVLLDQARLDEAITSFQRALQLKPDFAEAYCNQGAAWKELGKFAQAMECFQKAIALKPDYADALNNCAGILKDQGELEEAMRCCDRALALRPGFAAAHCNRGNIWLDLGHFENAANEFRIALANKPGYAEAIYNLAQMKTFQPRDRELTELESIDVSALPAGKQPYIHFALAKAFEDVKDYSRSFSHLVQGNRIKRQSLAYNESDALEHLQRIAKVFDAGYFRQDHGPGNPSEAPVFILGMPRSGSTLVEQILSSHPQIHGGGELKTLSRIIDSCSYPDGYTTIDPATLGRLAESYLQALPQAPAGKLRTTDKMPGNFVYVGLIHLMLPNARIIHTMRNPAATCFSCFSKLFNNGTLYSYDLAELGRYFMGYQKLMDHWRSVLPPGSFLDVSYENLIDDLEGQSRRMIGYCGLPWDDQCLQFHKTVRPIATASNLQARRPLYRSSVDRWQRYGEFLKPLLDELGPRKNDE